MSFKIEKKITNYSVVSEADKVPEKAPATVPHLVPSSGPLERPERLRGTTYKVKSPVLASALYITINDICLNEGTPQEHYRPFEVFINSKNMEHYQWIVALTRVMSAVFRKGGEVAFLVEELHSVFDPSGGYFKKGGKFIPSLVAEIGIVLEDHLKYLGIIKDEALDEHQAGLVAAKKQEYLDKHPGEEMADTGYPASAQICTKCNTKAAITMDGCLTCLECGESKCS